jgi:hypothetical protein
MTTTYYLLRTKSSAQGDGAYLGTGVDGALELVSTPTSARRFASLQEAEQTGQVDGAQFGGFEIEVRNAPT